MTRTLSNLGWIFVVIDFVAAAALVLRRDVGDAATRGLGTGLGTILAALGVIAALLLWAGRAPERPLLVIMGSVLAAAPIALGVTLTVSRQGLALIYPSLRDRGGPREASPQYAYPDAAGREAALALVLNDYAKLDTLLRATPAPDLAARDERGESPLGLATRTALMDGGSMRDLEGLRLLLAAGARPRPDDLGREESLIEVVASATSDRGRIVLELLLDAGAQPGRAHARRSFGAVPSAADAGGRTRPARTRRGPDGTRHARDAADWSPVTYQSDLHRWATALVLLGRRGSARSRKPTGFRAGARDPAWRGTGHRRGARRPCVCCVHGGRETVEPMASSPLRTPPGPLVVKMRGPHVRVRGHPG